MDAQEARAFLQVLSPDSRFDSGCVHNRRKADPPLHIFPKTGGGLVLPTAGHMIPRRADAQTRRRSTGWKGSGSTPDGIKKGSNPANYFWQPGKTGKKYRRFILGVNLREKKKAPPCWHERRKKRGKNHLFLKLGWNGRHIFSASHMCSLL